MILALSRFISLTSKVSLTFTSPLGEGHDLVKGSACPDRQDKSGSVGRRVGQLMQLECEKQSLELEGLGTVWEELALSL